MYRPCLHCEGGKYDESYCPEICTYGEARKRLKELEKSVALPCMVGDTVYPLNADRRFRAFIERIEITAEGIAFEWVQYDVGVDCAECWDDGLFTVDDIGKTVFLDETEYLIALKEREG